VRVKFSFSCFIEERTRCLYW